MNADHLKDFSNVKVRYVTSVEDVNEFMRWLSLNRYVLGYDSETEGLHHWEHDVRLAQFGDANTGWAFRFDRWAGVIEEVFENYTGPIVGHNIRFDARMLARHGIFPDQNQFHDTMLSANALWPDRKLGLKGLASQQLTPFAAQGQVALDDVMARNRWSWATVPIDHPAYWRYAALDTILTARLHELLMPQLEAANLLPVYEMECAVSRVLFKMEMRGAHINVPFCQDAYDKLHTYTDELRAYCKRNFGFAPGEKDAVIAYLKNWGYEFTKRTETGALALDEDVLLTCKTDYNPVTEEYNVHPLAELVLNVRKNEKIANTYLRGFLRLVDSDDMLHCNIKQVGAKTGRMSCSEPNLQNLPRDNVLVRNAFIPIDDAHRLVSIDFSQIEMRIFAHFAQESEMLRRIREGQDLHTAVAQMIYGLGDATPPKHLRAITKNANFAKVYFAGPAKFAETAHITEAEGRAFYEVYDGLFPGVRRFQQKVIQTGKRRYATDGECYVTAPSGRRHVANVDEVYKLTNYLIQGSAADVLKEKMIVLDNLGLTDYLWLVVHDECLFDVPADDADELTHLATQAMTDNDSFSVPLTVDASGPMTEWTK